METKVKKVKKDQIVEVNVYLSKDKKEFKTEEECLAHEKVLDEKESLYNSQCLKYQFDSKTLIGVSCPESREYGGEVGSFIIPNLEDSTISEIIDMISYYLKKETYNGIHKSNRDWISREFKRNGIGTIVMWYGNHDDRENEYFSYNIVKLKDNYIKYISNLDKISDSKKWDIIQGQ